MNDHRLRVLQLGRYYGGTGAERCARELHEHLSEVGVESSMWVGDRKPGDPDDIPAMRFSWESRLGVLEAVPDLTDWRHRGTISCLRDISTRDFDLVHIHNIHSGWISTRAVYDLTQRFPCVWTLHDEWAPNLGLTCNLTGKITPREVMRLSQGPLHYIPYGRYHENYKWRRTRRFLRKWLPQPRLVICPSNYMKELVEVSSVFPNSGIVHIPNGTTLLDVPEAKMPRLEAKTSFGLAPDRPVVLMISLDLSQAHKGMLLGVEALKEVEQSHGVQALLLGKASSQIAERIKPIPAVCAYLADDRSLARAYRAADLMLIPSLSENFPYVVLEAFACETPVLGFPIGGVPEMIGSNERGIVCKRIDSIEMSRHLSTLISNESLRRKMGLKAENWAREHCAMSQYLHSVLAAYRQALAGASSATAATIDQLETKYTAPEKSRVPW